jgi:hypothetical protein
MRARRWWLRTMRRCVEVRFVVAVASGLPCSCFDATEASVARSLLHLASVSVSSSAKGEKQVTRFAASLRTDNSPQPKGAQPRSDALTTDESRTSLAFVNN